MPPAEIVPLRGGEPDPMAAGFAAARAQLAERGGRPPPPPRGDGDAAEPPFGPVVPLGVTTRREQTAFVLLTSAGTEVVLSARDMHAVPHLSGLFGGAGARAWMADRWPHLRVARGPDGKPKRDDSGAPVMEPSGDFSARDLGDALMAACIAAGPAESCQRRRDGVWPALNGGLVVHAGGDIWTAPDLQARPMGWRDGPAIHLAAPPRWTRAERQAMERPATAEECRALLDHLQLWAWSPASASSSAPLIAGAIACGVYAGALRWRPHLWLRGPTNAGKSTLARFIAAAAGTEAPSTDVSEPYVRNTWDGRARLVVLDEREPNLPGVQAVLTLMRGASDGAVVGRLMDGALRTYRIACPFVVAAISTPAFEAQDASRISVVSLRRPGEGDRGAALARAAAHAAEIAPRLAQRLILGWARFGQNLAEYRAALIGRSATARCADQLGHLLAGWRTLLHDLPADAYTAAEDINDLGLDLTTPDQAAEEDAHAMVLRHLLASRVPIGDGRQSTTVAGLLEDLRDAAEAWAGCARSDPSAGEVKRALDKLVDSAGMVGLRWRRGEGLVVSNHAPLLNRAFDGTPWQNWVWQRSLRDIPGGCDAGQTRFRRGGQHRAWLLPEDALGLSPPRPPNGDGEE